MNDVDDKEIKLTTFRTNSIPKSNKQSESSSELSDDSSEEDSDCLLDLPYTVSLSPCISKTWSKEATLSFTNMWTYLVNKSFTSRFIKLLLDSTNLQLIIHTLGSSYKSSYQVYYDLKSPREKLILLIESGQSDQNIIERDDIYHTLRMSMIYIFTQTIFATGTEQNFTDNFIMDVIQQHIPGSHPVIISVVISLVKDLIFMYEYNPLRHWYGGIVDLTHLYMLSEDVDVLNILTHNHRLYIMKYLKTYKIVYVKLLLSLIYEFTRVLTHHVLDTVSTEQWLTQFVYFETYMQLIECINSPIIEVLTSVSMYNNIIKQ